MHLLEREAYLAELNSSLAEVSRGEGRLVLISGEAGIGKTSLVNHFARRRDPAIRLFWGVCDALFTPRPLSPLYDMAPQIGGELPGLLTSNAPRGSIFSACLDALSNHSAIAVFEDIHWADEATLDLLRFLGRRVAQTSALLLLTYRDDELGSRHPLRTLLGDLASSPAAHRILLPPLSEKAVRELIGEETIDAAALHDQTGGNPFFITEVLANPKSEVPDTVRDAVLARVVRLSASGHAVLEAAAVIGQRVEPSLLAAVTGAEAPAVEECMAAGMLYAQASELVFRHELAREAILEAISLPRKQVLHRLIFDTLRASPGARPDLTRLTHHAEAAGDREAVLKYAPAAARQAAAASAHHTATALYRLALRFAEDLPEAERAALLESYGRECFLVDHHSEGIAARRKAIELRRAEDNSLKLGENLAYLTSSLIAAGQNVEAAQVSAAAIELLERLPPSRALAQAYRVRATLHLVNRDCQEAIAWAEQALLLAERFGDEDIQSTAHNVIGTAWLFVDYPRGMKYLEQRLADEQTVRLEARVATAYSNLGSGSGELYRFDQAKRYLTAGIVYAYERDLEYQRLYMLAWMALTHLFQGNWDEAARVAMDVLLRPDSSSISRITALIALGRLRARRGDPASHPALEEALELARQTGTLQRLAPVHAARAEAAYLAGEGELALAEAHAVFDLALEKQHPWFAGELAYWQWRGGEQVEIFDWMTGPFVLEMQGDWQAAATAWAALGCPYEQARALAEGDTDAQVVALQLFEKLGAQPAADAVRQKLQGAGVSRIPRGPRPATRDNPFQLTNRQVEILKLLADNLTNAEIAARLHISTKTVDHHVSAVLARLNVETRTEAAALARQHPSLIPPK